MTRPQNEIDNLFCNKRDTDTVFHVFEVLDPFLKRALVRSQFDSSYPIISCSSIFLKSGISETRKNIRSVTIETQRFESAMTCVVQRDEMIALRVHIQVEHAKSIMFHHEG